MIEKRLLNYINSYQDFPKKGILFRDIMPVLSKPEVFSDLIKSMSSKSIFTDPNWGNIGVGIKNIAIMIEYTFIIRERYV